MFHLVLYFWINNPYNKNYAYSSCLHYMYIEGDILIVLEISW